MKLVKFLLMKTEMSLPYETSFAVLHNLYTIYVLICVFFAFFPVIICSGIFLWLNAMSWKGKYCPTSSKGLTHLENI